MVVLQQEQFIVCCFGRIEFGLYVIVVYLMCQGLFMIFDDLVSYVLIGFDSIIFFVCWVLQVYFCFQCEVFVMWIDSDFVQLSLICVGVGIGICQVFFVDGIIFLQ